MTTDAPDLDAIRAALAVATPAPWAEGYVQWAVRHIARNCDYEPADESEPDFCWDRYNDWPVIANAPVWLASLCDEIERLQAALDLAFSEAEAELRHRQEEIERLRAERTKAVSELRKAVDAGHVVNHERAAALAECERLRARLREEMGADE